jgi:branched-chain amino acid aminotransferase
MISPQQQFFISDSKIHTVRSSACIIPPPADHIYEVFRVINGVALFLEDHMERLQHSLDEAGISIRCDSLLTDIENLIKINGYATGNIKIILWKTEKSGHSMMFYDKHLYPTEQQFTEGVTLGLIEHERKNPNIKLFDSNMRKDASAMIETNSFYEVLLLNQEGFITEGSRSNIFFIKNDTLYTPPSNQVLEGVTRKRIIGIIKYLSLKFEEKQMLLKELPLFESVFITGTSRRVLPIKNIHSVAANFNTNHPIIRTLQTEFLQVCKEYIEAAKKKK